MLEFDGMYSRLNILVEVFIRCSGRVVNCVINSCFVGNYFVVDVEFDVLVLGYSLNGGGV